MLVTTIVTIVPLMVRPSVANSQRPRSEVGPLSIGARSRPANRPTMTIASRLPTSNRRTSRGSSTSVAPTEPSARPMTVGM